MRAERRNRVTETAITRAGDRRPLQRDVLRAVMLSANEGDTWLTLEELARITRFPAASISAQLRHFRKPRHGGFCLRKRCRAVAKPLSSGVVAGFPITGPLWEYRLQRPVRRVPLGGGASGGRKTARARTRGLKRKSDSRGGALWA